MVTALLIGIAGCGGGGGGSGSSGSQIKLKQGESATRQITIESLSHRGRFDNCPEVVCSSSDRENRRKRRVDLTFATSNTTTPGTYSVSFIVFKGGFGCAPFFGCVDEPIKVVKRYSYRVKVIANDEQVNASAVYPVTGSPRSIVSADLNSDGLPDIVTLNHEEQSSPARTIYSAFLARPDGQFEPETIIPSLADPDGDYAVKDVDQEKLKALIARQALEDSGPDYFAVGDINNDLLEDRVVASGHYVEVFLGRGSGVFDLAAKLSAGYEIGIIELADFDGDGIQDALLVQKDAAPPETGGVTAVSILLGDGVGGFSEPSTLKVPGRVLDVAVADLDGNGLVDYVVIGPDGNEVLVYLR
jgi:hypothetical protein